MSASAPPSQSPPDELTFICLHCEQPVPFHAESGLIHCPTCATQYDLRAHLAFLRGLDAFDDGQEAMMRLPKFRLGMRFSRAEEDALDLIREAYSSLQIAFEGRLSEEARSLGIEMMASMAQVLAVRLMISDLERQFWHQVMAELTAQREYDRLKAQVQQTRPTPLGKMRNALARRRMAVLLKAFERFNTRLELIESLIEFVRLPHARNLYWKP